MSAELPETVPGPVPPDHRDAWYAPDIRAQYQVAPGIVATISETEDGFHYRTREPPLGSREEAVVATLRDRVGGSDRNRPRTRDGAIDRMEAGLPGHWKGRLEPLAALPPGARRRVEYHLGAELRALGDLTPLALDGRIRIGDTTSERLTVHTAEFAPANTNLPAGTPHLEQFLSERVTRESVGFGDFEVPVTTVRRHLLGGDTFDRTYVIQEPDLLPGDESIVSAVKDRLLDSPPADVLGNEEAYVRSRARTLLRRRLAVRDSSRLIESLTGPFRRVLRAAGVRIGRAPTRPRSERVESLAYYVIRDLVGEGVLTIPLRDPRVRSIEANRVGDRVTVEAHRGTKLGGIRMPTSASIPDEDRFVGLARTLAAEGGVELNARTPTATVDLHRPAGETGQEVHCSVSLPSGTDGGAHISIRKRRATPQSPIELVDRGVLTPELVAAIWTVAANRGRIVFVGATKAEPKATLSAHTPFIPSTARPVALEPKGNPVDLPQETALTVPLEHPGGNQGDGTSPESATHRDVLHPDVVILPDLAAPGAFPRFDRLLAAGTGVIAASPMLSREIFATEALAAGVGPTVLSSIDLVVELPEPDASDTAKGWVPCRQTAADVGRAGADHSAGGLAAEGHSAEGLAAEGHSAGGLAAGPESERGNQLIAWEKALGAGEDEDPGLTQGLLKNVSDEPEADTADLAAAFRRRVQYVSYLRREGKLDRSALMAFLADLRTDEAATIERIQRTIDE